MKYFSNFFTGILIGCGAILPGVSSGVFCVIFGIYEKLIDSIVNFFRDVKKNVTFLFPIVIGAVVGIVLFGNIIKYLFETYKTYASFCFIGLILGTIPALFKQASNNKYVDIKKIIPLIVCFTIGIILIVIEKNINFSFELNIFSNNILYLFFVGFIMSIGIVVPGISNTIILMCLGVYSEYIAAIASLNLSILIPMGLGLVLGAYVWLKLIKFLFNKYYEATFYSIIGFTLGSVFVLLPEFNFDSTLLLNLVIFFIALISSYKLSNNYPPV